MKKLVMEEQGEGLEKLLGKTVLLMCSAYFYTGELIGVNASCVLLRDPAIVYETGAWTSTKWSDAQKLQVGEIYVQTAAIEAFFAVEKAI